MILETDTGKEYSVGFSMLTSASMPILTSDSTIFQANASWVSLVDPLNTQGNLQPVFTNYPMGILRYVLGFILYYVKSRQLPVNEQMVDIEPKWSVFFVIHDKNSSGIIDLDL